MKIVMDSDCLVKLTKAGAKEIVTSAIEVHIPHLVKKETVDDIKDRGYQDSAVIEENIRKRMLHVVRHRVRSPINMPVTKGEKEVLSIYLKGEYYAVASDDRKFLKKLDAAGIPYLTPAACIVSLYKNGKADKLMALKLLERLRPFISKEEYEISKSYMEGKL